jgi:hypothetical protein
MKSKNSSLNSIRWIARITGTLLAVLVLLFATFSIAGEIKEDGYTYSLAQILTFFFWGVAMLGLLLALWKEGLGGIISLSCLVLMYIAGLFEPEVNRSAMLGVELVLAVPAVLYILYWWASKRKNTRNENLDSPAV